MVKHRKNACFICPNTLPACISLGYRYPWYPLVLKGIVTLYWYWQRDQPEAGLLYRYTQGLAPRHKSFGEDPAKTKCKDNIFEPATLAEWLEGRLPRSVDDLKQWNIE